MIYSPFEIFLSIIVACSAMYSMKSNPSCSIAVIFSLFFGLLLSYLNQQEIHSHMMFFCFFVCVLKTKRNGIGFIDVRNNELIYAIALMYPIRMIIGLVAIKYNINQEIIWFLSTLVLFLQISLLVLGAENGGTKRVKNIHFNFINYRRAEVSNKKGI
ncbi:hypothetical protein OAA08_00980 [bacterium]|jgi:hypothetical protein|nr:hypothetical protein [bacterium]